MTNRLVVAALLLASGLAAGCANLAAPRYSISADTVSILRTYRGRTVAVGNFTAAEPGRTSIGCRGIGPVHTPDGETFEAYIRKALIDELTIAEIYSERAPLVLTGRLDEADFSSGAGSLGFGESSWTLMLTIGSSNGRTLQVTEIYRFPSSYMADAACNRVAQAFTPAVQNLIQKIVRTRDFAAMIGAD